MHGNSTSILKGVLAQAPSRTANLPPAFLLPAFTTTQTSGFSSSTAHRARKNGNPARGVSALRRSGLGKRLRNLSVKLENLPQPVLDPQRRSKVEVDDDHGLWQFFPPDRTALASPEHLNAHGRSWTVPELRQKDWDDLHRLYWVCVKERNRIATTEWERKRVGGRDGLYGEYEAQQRDSVVKETMKAIKHTLTERWYAWENARVAAMEDEEVNLYADLEKGEPAYIPRGSASEARSYMKSAEY